jgi:hypothetical protein
MEKYDVIDKVSSYLTAIGRIISTSAAYPGNPSPAPAPPQPPPRASEREGGARTPLMSHGNSFSSLHSPPENALFGSAPPTPAARNTALGMGMSPGNLNIEDPVHHGAFSAQTALGSAALTANLGSCVLIARTDRHRAVILTTSFVLGTRREAAEAEAIFFETKVLGAGIGNVPRHSVRVRLRPDRLFFTSAPDTITRMTTAQRRLHGASVGYTVVACDVEGSGMNVSGAGNVTTSIRPLTLPLIASKIPKISPGDLHLAISHVDGLTTRRSFGFTVDTVFDGHSTYTTSDLATTFASGGAVFNHNGEFIGLHHEFGDDNYCIHVASIVEHLYQSLVLGRIGIPIMNRNAEGHRTEPSEHDGSITGIDLLSRIDQEPYGDGSVVEDLGRIEYQNRKRQQRVRQTLVMRDHVEVFEELYDPNKYESLVLMLHAFHSHSKLLRMILDQLLSATHRDSMPQLAKLGGIGVLLEALASLKQHNVPVMTTGLTLVGRMSLYDDNREALSKYSGVQTILSLLQEYINSAEVVQWGMYALLNLVQPDCATGPREHRLRGDFQRHPHHLLRDDSVPKGAAPDALGLHGPRLRGGGQQGQLRPGRRGRCVRHSVRDAEARGRGWQRVHRARRRVRDVQDGPA